MIRAINCMAPALCYALDSTSTKEGVMDKDSWFEEFYGCLQDLGGSAYDEDRVLQKYEAGYSPADAAGEEVCEDDL